MVTSIQPSRRRISCATAVCPRLSSLLHREFIEENILRWMHAESLDALVVAGLHDTPKRLHHRPIFLQELFELGHDHPPLVGIENALRLRQKLVEFRVCVAWLVPWYTGTIGQPEHHDAKRPMGPRCITERPALPD